MTGSAIIAAAAIKAFFMSSSPRYSKLTSVWRGWDMSPTPAGNIHTTTCEAQRKAANTRRLVGTLWREGNSMLKDTLKRPQKPDQGELYLVVPPDALRSAGIGTLNPKTPPPCSWRPKICGPADDPG